MTPAQDRSRSPLAFLPLGMATVVIVFALAGAKTIIAGDKPGAMKPVDFTADIRPIFTARWVECHGPTKQLGGLRLDTLAGIQAGGTSGSILTAGKGSDALLIRPVTAKGDTARMPPKGEPLSSGQIDQMQA